METHMRMYTNGIVSVPVTNCRIVRPREMRARKSPTKEAHATHHAQKNKVQSLIHVPVSSNAKVCMTMSGNMLTKSPTLSTKASRRNWVLPVISTHKVSPIARNTLSKERNLMPLSTDRKSVV